MAGLLHDAALGSARRRRRGGEAGAQGVAGIAGGLEPSSSRRALHDQRHGATGETLASDAPVAVDAAKDAAARDGRGLEPSP